MQFIADMTGLEVAAAEIAECSPLGAALAGMVGMGVHRTLDDVAKLPREVIVYRPQMKRDEVERFYTGWQNAVKQVLAGASA
jgi:glycerol kinase